MDITKGPTGRINGLRELLSGLRRADVIGVLARFNLQQAAAYGFANSTDFDLVYEGKRFPPKAILGLAAERVVGRALSADEFSGGETSACFAVLRGLGFDIHRKTSPGQTASSSGSASNAGAPSTAPTPDAREPGLLPEEVRQTTTVIEGAKKSIAVNAYERDREARKRCIEHWGLACVVCGFDFERQYGDIGSGFIHVHHLKPLAEIGQEYTLDPVADLRPVCPNCHAMLHRGETLMTIEKLRIHLNERHQHHQTPFD